MGQLTEYAARPALGDPGGFARAAFEDLRRSGPIAWRLFQADLRRRHRRALLGYLWLAVPALATAAVGIYLEQRRIIEVGDTSLPYWAHIASGIVLWQLFVEALNSPLEQLSGGRQLITSSRVPHEALLLAGFLRVGFNASLRIGLLLLVLVVSGTGLGASVLLVPLGVVVVAAFGIALGLLLAPVGLLYDDVQQGLTLVTTFWFLLTPILYPAPDGGLPQLNPVTPPLDATRTFLTTFDADYGGALLVAAVTLLTLAGGWFFSRLARPHVVARLG